MKKLTVTLTFVLYCITSLFATDTIYVKINLKKLVDKKLKIEVNNNKETSGHYYFPKSIYGTYNHQNAGSKCNSFRTSKGVDIIKEDINSVKIPQCTSFEYYSNFNKWDYLSPEGSVAIKDSVFVFNWYSIIGYFNNTDKTPYSIEIIKPECLKPYSTLEHKEANDSTLTLYASNYDELIDKPLMMFKSGVKTKQFTCNSKTFNIVSFSSTDENPVDSIYNDLKRTVEIATKYLRYPNKEYTFFIYATKNKTTHSALEHKDNSVNTINMNRMFTQTYSILYSMMIHEFIHACYLPLVVRSNVIENFDYQNPKCDEHLWLYEGVTEYLTQKVKYTSGYYTKSEFIKEMYNKYAEDKMNKRNFIRLRNASLTKLSKDIYSWYGRRNYGTVYNRGALVAMMLDIEIIKSSNGEKNLFDIVEILRDRYTHKSFDSKDIINEINSIVNVERIISRYIRGRKNINPKYIFGVLGYNVLNKKEEKSYYYVKIKSVKYIKTKYGNGMVISKSDINKAFGKKELTILKINNKANPTLEDIHISASKMNLTILRNGKIESITFNKLLRRTKSKHVKILKNSNNKNDMVANRFWGQTL